MSLSGYEGVGAVDGELVLTSALQRKQRSAVAQRQEEIARRCVTAPLSWGEYQAGEVCPGCGLAYVDAEPFFFSGTLNLSEEERVRYEAEQARFTEAHVGCEVGQFRVGSYSITAHCNKCCPPPPPSPGQLRDVQTLMQSAVAARATQPRVRWRLRLFCGHVVQRSAPASVKVWSQAFASPLACTECGLVPATVVAAEAEAVEPAPGAGSQRGARRRGSSTAGRSTSSRLALEAEVAALRARVAELEADQQ